MERSSRPPASRDADRPGGADLPLLRPERSLDNLPAVMALLYAAASTLWIVLSDLALHDFDLDSATDDIAKGLVFVAITALLLWWTLRRLLRFHDQRLLSRLGEERDFYRTILHTAGEAVAIFGNDGRVQWTNQAVEHILGWRPTEVVGQRARFFIDERDRIAAIGYIENAMASADVASTVRTFQLRHRSGETRTMEVRAAPLHRHGEIEGVVLIGRDVTERIRREDRIHALSAGDVSGLPALASFTTEIDWLERVLEGVRAIIVVIDIERFGSINELHGRTVGDQVLREVAQRFGSELVEATGCWRHGGDAFIAVLIERPDDDPVDRREIVDRLRRQLGAPLAIDVRQRIHVDLAIGIAEVTVGQSQLPLASALLQAGEESLRRAKAHPDRFDISGGDDASWVEDRAHVVAELYDALAGGQLVAYHQPIVELGSGAVVGSEALVRWQHPTRGLLSPGAFFWAVQYANLTGEVARTVLQQALQQVAEWRSTHEGHHYTVSVNLTLNELRREGFIDELMQTVEGIGVEPSALCLELTEQALLSDVETTTDALARLRSNGVRISIDDFGTGFSSLEHLRYLDIDELKIDRSFVTDLRAGSADDVIVSSLIRLAEGLGVSVVAEGIEDETALAHLRDLGCARGQGYLFGRPVPAEDFPHRMEGGPI